MIEPINARNVPGYFLNDFGFARDLITELKIPNLKLQFDIYHCQIIHGDVTMRLREMMPIIGHIQIASIPSRNEPDGEELNYPFLFAELDRLGYGGFVGCEYQPARQDHRRPRLVQALCRSEAVTLALGCIADDYTGASDLANTLTRSGLRTVQTIGVPSDDLALPEVDAVVVSLKSRSIEAGACGVALARGGKMAARPRRRPCAVQDLLDLRFHRRRQYRPGDGCAARRFRRRDRAGDAGLSGDRPHRLSGQSVRRRRAAERKPAEGSSAQPDARFQSGAGAGAAEPDQGRAGRSRRRSRAAPDAVRARLADLAGKGIGAAIVDAVFDRDLETIGAVALDHRLSVGASGIGLGLARALVASGKVKSSAAGRGGRRAGRRAGGVPGRQLLAGDAAADRQRRSGDAGAASRSRPDRRRARTKRGARWPGRGTGSATVRS